MPGCGEPGHVDTDLSDACLRGELTDPGDRLEKLSRRLESDDTLHDLSGEGLDRVIEEVDVSERSEEHTSELQSLLRISYAVFCLKRKSYTIYISCITKRYCCQ